LAIARHEKEREELHNAANLLSVHKAAGLVTGYLLGFLLLLLGSISLVRTEFKVVGFVMTALGVGALVRAYRRANRESLQLTAMRDQMSQLQSLITAKRKIADG
jgi:high-affinity Fe2+/Pb2+ permease